MISISTSEMHHSNNSPFNLRCRTLLFLTLVLLSSTNSTAKTFFESNTPKPSGYFNNEEIRQEKIDSSKQVPTVHYSQEHKRVSDYFNSGKDQLATHTEWESKTVLRIGIIKRRFKQNDYLEYACQVVSASGLSENKVTIRMIYLPSLIATQQLNVLVEKSCS